MTSMAPVDKIIKRGLMADKFRRQMQEQEAKSNQRRQDEDDEPDTEGKFEHIAATKRPKIVQKGEVLGKQVL